MNFRVPDPLILRVRVFIFGYDALGRRTGLTRPNGVNTSYTYDSVSRLLSVLHQTGNTTLDGASYAYDAAGNRTSKTALPSNVASAYSYDPVYELTKVLQGATTKESYTYDAVGNRTYQPGAPYTYNSSNEMLTREGVPYTYDANGNTLSKTNGSATTSYAWDFENRLTSVTLPGTGGAVSFQYDPFGRRIQKTNASGTTAYVYDGDNIVEELTGSGGTIAERYTYGPGIDEPLVGQRQPLIFYYEADGLGSVTSLTTPTGNTAATYTYDSFGFLTASTGSATNWYRYTARQFDCDTALYYYRARYYDPTSGRFLSGDPTGFNGGVNFYSYSADDPVNYTDPSGLCPPKGIDCSTAPPAAPPGPAGQSVDKNIQLVTNQVLQSLAADSAAAGGEAMQANLPAFISWLNNVRPFGDWDYAHNAGQQYAAFGNFNFGATCNALGLSVTACQRGAGLAAYGTAAANVLAGGKWTAGPGNPLGAPANVKGVPDYGDQPSSTENLAVIAGWIYAQWQLSCKK